jgi:hypothetical protein
VSTLNFCHAGNPSLCEAAERPYEHSRCKFYGRSPSRHECLWHYSTLCTCAAAKADARKETKNNETPA